MQKLKIVLVFNVKVNIGLIKHIKQVNRSNKVNKAYQIRY